MNKSIHVENEKQAHQKPPLSRRRIAGEILAGMGMSFAVVLLLECVLARVVTRTQITARHLLACFQVADA